MGPAVAVTGRAGYADAATLTEVAVYLEDFLALG